jgi:hypothetical protein
LLLSWFKFVRVTKIGTPMRASTGPGEVETLSRLEN